MTVGGNIRKIRERRGITQTELAIRLGISSRTVSSWEVNRTEPKMGMLEKVCMVLNCRKSDIIEDTEYDIPLKNENPALLELAKQMDPALRALQDKIGELTIENRISVEIFVDALLAKQDKEKEIKSQSSKEA